MTLGLQTKSAVKASEPVVEKKKIAKVSASAPAKKRSASEPKKK